jgi:hypothetical protein
MLQPTVTDFYVYNILANWYKVRASQSSTALTMSVPYEADF